MSTVASSVGIPRSLCRSRALNAWSGCWLKAFTMAWWTVFVSDVSGSVPGGTHAVMTFCVWPGPRVALRSRSGRRSSARSGRVIRRSGPVVALAGQAAVEHQCAVDLLHSPSPGLLDEALAPGHRGCGARSRRRCPSTPWMRTSSLKSWSTRTFSRHIPHRSAAWSSRAVPAALSWAEAAGTTTPMIQSKDVEGQPPAAPRYL